MIHLILVGSPEDHALTIALRQALSASFQVATLGSDNRLQGCGEAPPDFLLLECEHFFCEENTPSIILCKKSFPARLQKSGVQGAAVGVLQPDNAAAAMLLSQLGIPAISCGMSLADTLTFSSLRAESAVLCIQRSIPTLSGGIVEPSELLLRLSRPYDTYALMCIVAVLLLSGNEARLQEILL